MKDINSLSHTKWNCKYHIVFSPKYRRQAIYKTIKADIGQIIRKLCEIKKVEIIHTGKCMFRTHTYIGKNTAEYKCGTVHGIFERKKFLDDI